MYALHHSHKTVAACGREVFAQADAVDEVEVGVEYFLRGVSAEHAYEQCDNAFDDEGVALGAEVEQAGALVADDIRPSLERCKEDAQDERDSGRHGTGRHETPVHNDQRPRLWRRRPHLRQP